MASSGSATGDWRRNRPAVFLRRSEAAALAMGHAKRRDGRRCIAALICRGSGSIPAELNWALCQSSGHY